MSEIRGSIVPQRRPALVRNVFKWDRTANHHVSERPLLTKLAVRRPAKMVLGKPASGREGRAMLNFQADRHSFCDYCGNGKMIIAMHETVMPATSAGSGTRGGLLARRARHVKLVRMKTGSTYTATGECMRTGFELKPFSKTSHCRVSDFDERLKCYSMPPRSRLRRSAKAGATGTCRTANCQFPNRH